MMKARLVNPELLNEFEMLLVADYMDKKYPGVMYSMAPGNDCIWVYFGLLNLYFIFRNGKIADIQVD
jgi:hypothetical protein